MRTCSSGAGPGTSAAAPPRRLPPPTARPFFSEVFPAAAATLEYSAADLPPLPSWDTLLDTLRDCSAAAGCSVLVLKDQHPTAPGESACLASAYLDGCSIIVNHAEAGCAPLAAPVHEGTRAGTATTSLPTAADRREPGRRLCRSPPLRRRRRALARAHLPGRGRRGARAGRRRRPGRITGNARRGRRAHPAQRVGGN